MNSQEKQFLDAGNTSDLITTSNSTPILSHTYNYLSSTDLTGGNTNYLISIPDGEITFEELNRTMNTLSNAVAHMQTKIAVMQSVEKPKCKPRKLDI